MMTMVQAALWGMGAIVLYAFGAMCLALWAARRPRDPSLPPKEA